MEFNGFDFSILDTGNVNDLFGRKSKKLRIAEWIDLYIMLCWMKIQNFVDRYIFHTKWCPEHGYNCHKRCSEDKLLKEPNFIYVE